jgi:hypothetical protein
MRSPNIQQRLYLARAMNEQLEGIFDHDRQLNELSKKTYGNYIKKASKDAVNAARKHERINYFDDVSRWRFKRSQKKIQNRLKGIERATDAMSEDVEGIFDHDRQLAEGSYAHSKGELKKAVKGSKKEIGKAYKKGDKKAMKSWLENKKDAEEQLGNIKEEEKLDEMATTPAREKEWKNRKRRVHSLSKTLHPSLGSLWLKDRTEYDWKKERDSDKVHGKGGKVLKRKPRKGDHGKVRRGSGWRDRAAAYAGRLSEQPVMEAGEAELRRARKAEAQARKYAVQRTGTTVDGKVIKAHGRVQKLRLKKLTKERLKTGLNPRIDDTRANRSYPHQATGSMGPITKGYRAKHVIPKKVLDYRAASQAKKQAALRSKGVA